MMEVSFYFYYRLWRFSGFQNGGRPPSWIFEIQIISGLRGCGPILHNPAT